MGALLLRREASFAWATCGATSHVNLADSHGTASLLFTPKARYVITNNIEAARLQEAIREAAGGLACEDGIRAGLAGMEASTLHRLLGRRTGFPSSHVQGDEEPLPYDAVVVDEASMVSLQLLYSLVRVLPAAARLILLGDRDQLASVEAGAVLGDICGPDREPQYSGPFGEMIAAVSGRKVPLAPTGEIRSPIGDCIVELRRNYRFGAGSGIGALARAINCDLLVYHLGFEVYENGGERIDCGVLLHRYVTASETVK